MQGYATKTPYAGIVLITEGKDTDLFAQYNIMKRILAESVQYTSSVKTYIRLTLTTWTVARIQMDDGVLLTLSPCN